jgi:hypothetical protein
MQTERKESGREKKEEADTEGERERGRERAQHFIVASSAEVFMS